jgi:hypothetical protein
MTQLTLEALAERVALLEQKIAELTRTALPRKGSTIEATELMPTTAPGIRPGTGDWDAFAKAAARLRATYDFEAIRDQDECDRRHANDHLP